MFQNVQNLLETALIKSGVVVYAANKGWSLDSFFNNVKKATQKYGGQLLMVVGTAALIWSIIQAFRKYVFQSQEVRASIGVIVGGMIAGAAFMLGGWNLANQMGQGLGQTAQEFGTASEILLQTVQAFIGR